MAHLGGCFPGPAGLAGDIVAVFVIAYRVRWCCFVLVVSRDVNDASRILVQLSSSQVVNVSNRAYSS